MGIHLQDDVELLCIGIKTSHINAELIFCIPRLQGYNSIAFLAEARNFETAFLRPFSLAIALSTVFDIVLLEDNLIVVEYAHMA